MAARIGLAAVCVFLSAVAGVSQQVPQLRDPTARPVWRTTQATIGTPAISGEDVFALTADHQLLKVSLSDGSELWRVGTGEEGVTYGHALAVTPDSVLVGEYDIAAFDRVTGRRQWIFAPRTGYAPGPYLGDVERDEVAFAGSASGHLYALDVRTGQLRWTAIVDRGENSTVYLPRVNGNQVVAGFTHHAAPSAGGMVSVGIRDGQERWRFTFPTRTISTHLAGGPVIADDVIVATSGDGQVWGIDLQTGALRWTLPPIGGDLDSIVRPGDQDHRPLALVQSTLVIGSTTGYVLGYDLTTRHEVWRYAGGRLGSTAFAIGNGAGLALVPYVSGFLVALDGATGQLRWRTDDWQQGFIWPPALAGPITIAGSRQGLWALRINSEDEP